MLTKVRSSLHVMIMLEGVKKIEVKIVGRELDDNFLHDGLPAYNFLQRLGVKHDDVTFGLRNFVE